MELSCELINLQYVFTSWKYAGQTYGNIKHAVLTKDQLATLKANKIFKDSLFHIKFAITGESICIGTSKHNIEIPPAYYDAWFNKMAIMEVELAKGLEIQKCNEEIYRLQSEINTMKAEKTVYVATHTVDFENIRHEPDNKLCVDIKIRHAFVVDKGVATIKDVFFQNKKEWLGVNNDDFMIIGTILSEGRSRASWFNITSDPDAKKTVTFYKIKNDPYLYVKINIDGYMTAAYETHIQQSVIAQLAN